jgi:Ser/Thr protein kinase RdoA (MazF antagonist)
MRAADAERMLLQRYGLRAGGVRRISRQDCEVFRVPPARPGAPELALRVYAAERQAAGPIDDEITWLAALADRGLHVPRPIAALDGSLLQRLPADGAEAPRFAVLLTWLHGRMLYAGLRAIHLRRCGELIAAMHITARELQAQGRLQARQRADWVDLDGWAHGTRARSPHLAPAQHRLVQAAAARLLEVFAQHRAADVQGFIHGDLHPWNLLFEGGRCGAIDFSDCGTAPLMLDLASVLQFLKHPLPMPDASSHRRPPYTALRDALLEGLGGTLMQAPGAAELLEAHIAERMIGTLQWICDDWPHPGLRPWGPPFLAQMGQVLRPLLKG